MADHFNIPVEAVGCDSLVRELWFLVLRGAGFGRGRGFAFGAFGAFGAFASVERGLSEETGVAVVQGDLVEVEGGEGIRVGGDRGGAQRYGEIEDQVRRKIHDGKLCSGLRRCLKGNETERRDGDRSTVERKDEWTLF